MSTHTRRTSKLHEALGVATLLVAACSSGGSGNDGASGGGGGGGDAGTAGAAGGTTGATGGSGGNAGSPGGAGGTGPGTGGAAGMGASGGGTSGSGGAGGSGASGGTGGTGAAGGTAGAGATGGTGGTGATGGMPAGLPVGIPQPTFGWQHDTDVDADVYVDNTNPACNDAIGTVDEPYCDLFRGGQSVTYDAGTVVHVLGGPYVVSGSYTLTLNGSETDPVIVTGRGAARILFDAEGARADFEYAGSYAIVENLDFFHGTRHRLSADFFALRNVAVHNPSGAFIDFNPVVSVLGHDVLIRSSEVFHNRRATDADAHGIQASEGSFNVWILDNELYDNNGDSFQACHQCFTTPPHHVYLGRNVMHDDRENAVDLKTIHDVVVSENVMYGYAASATSNGDAMVIGSNGFDASINQGPRRVWVLDNEIRDSATGIRIEGSEDVWIVGNSMRSLAVGLQIDDKPHRDVVIAANTILDATDDGIRTFGCQPATLEITNNIVANVGDRHLDVGACSPPAVTITSNLFAGEAVSVRVDGTQHGDVGSLDAQGFATGNRFGDPAFEPSSLVPSSGSPAIDAGAPLDGMYGAYPYGPTIAVDRAGTPRPAGGAEDIGAYERP